jgi:FkbM family methyltransferase
VNALKSYAAASAWAAGVDLVRLGSIRHPIGRRARMMARLGVDLVIDVGANRGQFGLEIRRAGYRGRILSIEPLTEPFQFLARLAAKDNRWDVIQSAVGPSSGSATIHVAANGGASSSLLPMLDLHTHAAPKATFVGDEQVEVAMLDDLVRLRGLDGATVFTKVDVQGYELQVLAGGSEALTRSSLVQLEMSLLPLYETGPTHRDILEYMEGRGFLLVGIEPGFASPTGLLLQADGLFAAEREVRSLQAIRS